MRREAPPVYCYVRITELHKEDIHSIYAEDGNTCNVSFVNIPRHFTRRMFLNNSSMPVYIGTPGHNLGVLYGTNSPR